MTLYLYNEALDQYNGSLNQYNEPLHRVNVTLYLYNEALQRFRVSALPALPAEGRRLTARGSRATLPTCVPSP